MNQKTILIVAGLAVLAFVLMSASTREEPPIITPPPAPAKPKGAGFGIAAMGDAIGKYVQQFLDFLGRAEQERRENLLRDWQNRNVFKVDGLFGYGDFLQGKVAPASELTKLLDRVKAYRRYLDTPAAWDSNTKARVKNRYKDSADIVIRQINDEILKNF